MRIYDHEICGDKAELGATCFHMLSDTKRKLSFEAWASERFGQLCMKPDAYANLVGALLKLCESSGRCSWQEMQDIKKIGSEVSNFQTEMESNTYDGKQF